MKKKNRRSTLPRQLLPSKEELEERAALIAEGCGISQKEGLREAIKQAKKAIGNRSWTQERLPIK